MKQQQLDIWLYKSGGGVLSGAVQYSKQTLASVAPTATDEALRLIAETIASLSNLPLEVIRRIKIYILEEDT